jgi:hypothetical protein
VFLTMSVVRPLNTLMWKSFRVDECGRAESTQFIREVILRSLLLSTQSKRLETLDVNRIQRPAAQMIDYPAHGASSQCVMAA